MLPTLSSICNLLGLGASFLLKGKQIIQALCAKIFKRDKKVPQDIRNDWNKLINQLNILKLSGSGYGQASYLRLVRMKLEESIAAYFVEKPV